MTSREDYYNLPISINDAASMFRKPIKKNEKPYTNTVVKLNNSMVDDWKKTILEKLADKRGTVPSGKLWGSWTLYLEGREVKRYIELRDKKMINRLSKEQLEFWKDFFDNLEIGELHSYGAGMVSYGWALVQNEIRMWCADEKWDKIFSHSDDPLQWEKMSYKHQDLLKGKIYPFWTIEKIIEIKEKVYTILLNTVNPQK